MGPRGRVAAPAYNYILRRFACFFAVRRAALRALIALPSDVQRIAESSTDPCLRQHVEEVALVLDGTVISAYIGDIMADEVYGYRPDSKRVFRISRLDHYEELEAPEPVDMSKLYVMLRDPPEEYGNHARSLLPHFKNYEIMGSSIGTWAARLWKREVGALLMPEGNETPWDSTPVIGISQALGYVFMRPAEGHAWEEYVPELPIRVMKREHDTLIVHSTIADQFKRSFAINNA
jgi:hypothetical protein